MAMIKCPECDKDISDKAVSCPNCGYPLEKYAEDLNRQSSSQYDAELEPIIAENYRGNQGAYKRTSKRLIHVILMIATALIGSFWILVAIISILESDIDSNIPKKSFSEVTDTEKPKETNQPTAEPTPSPKPTQKELFVKGITKSKYISKKTAQKVYSTLREELKFKKIEYDQKNPVGDTNFDIVADNYSLMITVDNDCIYRIICGSYTLMVDEKVKLTKTDLDDRHIGDNDITYYVIAQEIVTNNLKSPKSARFPSISSGEVTMQRKKDYVAVQAYVDAKNSFNTDIRNKFLVEFRVLDLDNFSYELIYLNLEGSEYGTYKKLD